MNSALYLDATEHLSNELRNIDSSVSIVVAEIARKNYSENLDLLVQAGIHPDLIVYIDVPLDIAHQRNIWRKKVDGAHYVSEEEMRSTFSGDDSTTLQSRKDIRFLRIENPAISEAASEIVASEILGEFKNSMQKNA